jgi:hypothetical protein
MLRGEKNQDCDFSQCKGQMFVKTDILKIKKEQA